MHLQDISTINGVVLQGLEIKDSLHLESIVCGFNEGTYANATQIKYTIIQKSLNHTYKC